MYSQIFQFRLILEKQILRVSRQKVKKNEINIPPLYKIMNILRGFYHVKLHIRSISYPRKILFKKSVVRYAKICVSIYIHCFKKTKNFS